MGFQVKTERERVRESERERERQNKKRERTERTAVLAALKGFGGLGFRAYRGRGFRFCIVFEGFRASDPALSNPT